MELGSQSIGLGHLTEAQLQSINKVIALASCWFKLDLSTSTQKILSEAILVQLRGDYIVQVNPTQKTVITGFQCDYSVNFEIVRNPPPTTTTLGTPYGLELIFTEQKNKKLRLLSEDPKSLENLGKKLSRKYIVQLGFKDCFKAIKILGKGVTATVYKALNFSNQGDVAIKSFKRSVYFAAENGKLSFQKEFKILTLLDHKNVCALEGVYETENSTYIVMENLALSLFGWIQKYGFPTFQLAKNMIYQLLRGIEHLHERGLMHRDLKLENIMVRKDSKENVEMVIVDMGLAEFVGNTKYLYTRCGTPGYVAPEILKAKTGEGDRYNQSCDIFSLGVIFHILFFKKSLFQGSEVKEVIKKNTQCNINFDQEYLNAFNSEGLDLLKKMLDKDPFSRISARDALSHAFLSEFNMKEAQIKVDSTLQSINQSINNIN